MSSSESVEDGNIRTVKSGLEGVNSHDLNRAVECDAESIINYVPTRPEGVAGKAVEIEEMAGLFRAFPDVQFVTEQIVGPCLGSRSYCRCSAARTFFKSKSASSTVTDIAD
jgi:hypothetical protein